MNKLEFGPVPKKLEFGHYEIEKCLIEYIKLELAWLCTKEGSFVLGLF